MQNCEVEGPGLYGERLGVRDLNWRLVRADLGEPLPSPGAFDRCVVGGTPTSARDLIASGAPLVSWLARVLDAGRPILGICCAAQLLGNLLGAAVASMSAMEIGIATLHRTEHGRADPLLAGFPDELTTFQWHADYVDVPPGAELLITGDVCPPQMYRAGSAAGLLFHLEVTARAAEKWTAAYAPELAATGTSTASLLAQVRAAEPEMARLAALLVDNWLDLA